MGSQASEKSVRSRSVASTISRTLTIQVVDPPLSRIFLELPLKASRNQYPFSKKSS